MKFNYKITFIYLIFLFNLLSLTQQTYARTSFILKKVKKLEARSEFTEQGLYWNHPGTFRLYCKTKIKEIHATLAPVYVFSAEIYMEDLKTILLSRVDSYTNPQSPLHGSFDHLIETTLDTIKYGMDPDTISIIVSLFNDPCDDIKGKAVETLIFMAENNSRFKDEIMEIEFPKEAIFAAQGRSMSIPGWVKIKEDKNEP